MSMAQAPAPAPLPPWLGDPRRTVLQVEAFVVGAAILLFFQLIFGFFRRQSSNMFIQGGVWVAYTLSFPLITYTLGMMQSSPVKSPMYPVWSIALFLVAGCTNSITAYDLDDNKQWKRQLFELFQYYCYAALIFRLLSPTATYDYLFRTGIILPWNILFGMIFITNLLRVIACWMVNLSDPSKVVADYMRDQADSARHAQQQQHMRDQAYSARHAQQQQHMRDQAYSARHVQQQQHGPPPIRMTDYRYLVRWYGYTLKNHGAQFPYYTNKLPNDVITIDMIWARCNDGLFDSNGDSQLKDVCLSFALFQLLKRRFFGMNCYEADLPETRPFVLRGLLSARDNGYDRAFRIIEVELGFLHDFFFTRYASVYEMENIFFATFILKIIFTVMLGISVYRNPLILATLSPIVKVDTKTVDTMITLVILGALVIVEMLQALLYLASDWALVSLACNYVRSGSCQAIRYSLLRKPIWILRRRSLFKYWQNQIGQYSIIESCNWHVSPPEAFQTDYNLLLLFFVMKAPMLLLTILWKILTCQYCRRIAHSVSLPDIVKGQIASSIQSINGHLTNGEASLQRNRVLNQFSDRVGGNQTDTMLIWHIATSYCEIVLPRASNQQSNYREVATKLSRYCAHLMAFVPQLLPGNSADTKFTFDKVMEEAAAALPRGQDDIRDPTVVDRLLQVTNQQNTIFNKGLKLGRELEGIQDDALRWKGLAEFWAETILYVAPSDNVRGHIEQLANGGEFLTHVWALLSHAGILTRH